MIIVPVDEKEKDDLIERLNYEGRSYRTVNIYDKTVVFLDGKGMSTEHHIKHLYSREFRDRTIVDVAGVRIGESLTIAAGPCAVENEEQVMETASLVKRYGADMLRGGAYKPRTSPYSFQGLGKDGIRILERAKDEFNIPIVTEIMNPEYYEIMENVDMLQVGSRNAQNFDLLRFLGKKDKPVLLKNGMGNTIGEWLDASEYILNGGNGNIVMCYRGVRGIEESTRFTMNIGTVIAAKRKTHLPVCVDPSHASGKREYVESMALAAVAAGSDMIEVEVHNDPECALSDSEQQLYPDDFRKLAKKLRKLKTFIDGMDEKTNIQYQ